MYRYLNEMWKRIRRDPEFRAYLTEKRREWRRGKTIERVEKPTRIDKARQLGYRAKQGYVVARVRVRKGGLSKIPPALGRRQKRMGITKIKRGLSAKEIAEQRAKKRFRNLDVLGAYYLGEDGKYIWYEVVMKDPLHPAVKSVTS
jgi:large subunit ribosomal protein L15e